MSKKAVMFPYGEIEIEVKIPKENLLNVVMIEDPVGLAEEEKEIEKALLNPIEAEPLHEIVKPHNKVALLISDVTRPVPSYKIVPPILKELSKVPIPNDKITIVVATGLHRSNTKSELQSMLGSEILEKVKVVNHDAFNKGKLAYFGKTSKGTSLEINKLVVNADVRIGTGYIEPHIFAGFTGGRKSILGVLGADTINSNHRPEMLDHPRARIGVLDGNPIHEEILEVAEMVGVDFIVNVVLNRKKEISKVVAGNLKIAHLEGVRFFEQYARVKINQPADIVVASSGHPLDINLYQGLKSVVAAEPFVKDEGVIILLAECRDGMGPPIFNDWMKTCHHSDDIIERIRKEGYRADVDMCYILARILKKCDVIVVSQNPSVRKIEETLVRTAESAEEALNMALSRLGDEASVIALPYATRIIPSVI